MKPEQTVFILELENHLIEEIGIEYDVMEKIMAASFKDYIRAIQSRVQEEFQKEFGDNSLDQEIEDRVLEKCKESGIKLCENNTPGDKN